MRKIPIIKTIVIKIGSNIITDQINGINQTFISELSGTISRVKEFAENVVIVSSGSVAAGFRCLGYKSKPEDIIDKQACAAVGQTRLIRLYEKEFSKNNINVAQILLTKDDLSNRRRYLNARYTIRKLLEHGSIPIINENDSVVVDELKYIESFGDNDNLSALVAGLISADMLLILSDVEGLFDKDPTKYADAKLVSEVKYVNNEMLNYAGDSVSGIGTGGMKSKIKAAKKALDSGCYVGIINGNSTENVLKFLRGEETGTFFSHIEDPKNKKKLWLAYATIPKGDIVVDDGAVRAVRINKKSLLPSGIVDVSGKFGIGDVVRIVNKNEEEIGRGKVRYSHFDLKKIMGRKTSEIYDILGYKFSDEVIHRDDMVLEIT
ncbi:Glutamate 5-kinase [Flexistipes sinusarabici DSM 4947]|uniref:Glutamate 5-kinase n=2 Tax=Flexistipes sinusarabici TaxID=2352 RepID=F8E7X4_FLESM|nr:glutamate 5-kinase [Flexistipes sinusarabici]AEI15042.1 Glutamate 5-kinase [Flexistipes sinusarabici DSM 4947]